MLKVNIVGVGPGNPELLTRAAQKAINEATIIIADGRLLTEYGKGKSCYATTKIEEITAHLRAADSQKDIVSVLVSGDVGFYSLAKSLSNKLQGYDVHQYCGISSLVYFAQKLGLTWSDAKLMSMHGRNEELLLNVRENAKVFTLTGGTNTVNAICQSLVQSGFANVMVYVGEALSYPEEKITSGRAEELVTEKFASLAVMLIVNPAPHMRMAIRHGLKDECFVREDKVPMTKSEIRAVITSKMRIDVTDTVYDIGAGSGSCTVEFALHAYAGMVYAFERNAAAAKLSRLNFAKASLKNVQLLEGEALDTIQAMPAPDCVFIGGSGGTLAELLDCLYAKNPWVRVVISAITLETLADIAAYYKCKPGYDVEIVNVSVSKAKKRGNYHLLLAQNPIYIATIEKEDGEKCK